MQDKRFLQENKRYQGNILCKDGHKKGQKHQGPNRSRRDYEDVARIYRKTLPKKGLNDPDNHDGVVTHLEPNILECEVKRAFGSITKNKASGGDGILAELFQIRKDDVVKVLLLICQ